MQAKKKNELRIVVSVKQKQTIYYAIAGATLAVVGGLILFFYLQIGFNENTFAAGSDNTSIQAGLWTANSIWDSGSSPGTNVPQGKDIQVRKYVESTNSLSFAKDAILTITDTLVVFGDLTIAKDASLVIEAGGVLVVVGDLDAAKDLSIASGGVIAVGGNATFAKDLDYSGDAGSELFVVGTVSEKNTSELGGAQDGTALENRYPDIYGVITGTNTTLPITLLSFDATVQQQAVLLEWMTESEINNDYFTIERSVDGKNPESVGTLPGAGTTQTIQSYFFVDDNPLPGTSYYRLRQTDFDGQTEAFDWVAVSFENGSSQLVATPVIEQVFPNPVITECRVSFTLSAAGTTSLEVVDMQGTTLVSRVVSGQAGHNEHTLSDLHRLQPGTYLLRLVHQGEASPVYRILKR